MKLMKRNLVYPERQPCLGFDVIFQMASWFRSMRKLNTDRLQKKSPTQIKIFDSRVAKSLIKALLLTDSALFPAA